MEKRIDQRGKLEEEVFAYRITKDKKVFLSWQGRPVTTLSGSKATRFIADIQNKTGRNAQMIMAKATGHFKHGNERAGRQN